MIAIYHYIYEELTIVSLSEIKAFDCRFIHTLNLGVIALKFTIVSPSIFRYLCYGFNFMLSIFEILMIINNKLVEFNIIEILQIVILYYFCVIQFLSLNNRKDEIVYELNDKCIIIFYKYIKLMINVLSFFISMLNLKLVTIFQINILYILYQYYYYYKGSKFLIQQS